MDMSTNPLVHTNEFELHDFIEEANFDQFIDLIRGENEHVTGFDCDLVNGMVVDSNQFGHAPDDLFVDFSGRSCTAIVPDQNYDQVAFPTLEGGIQEYNDGEDSSGRTPTTKMVTTVLKKTKPDRSRTLISERRRRGRMKEKLYTLRSLVPNITKMDKASIVGDAALYVQELQAKAKKLKAEIAGLESSLAGPERNQESIKNLNKIQIPNNSQLFFCKKIIQMDVFQVEQRGFYVRLACNKGEGVAVSLYRALESLSSFNVESSSMATACERFILTFTLHVRESELDMNLPNLKLWVTGALLNQGFELSTSLFN